MKVIKNYKSLMREYDQEKYSTLDLLDVPNGEISLWSAAIDAHIQETQSTLKSIAYLEKGLLKYGEFISVLKRYRNLLNQDLSSISDLGEVRNICELGSGLGQNLDKFVEAGLNVLSLEISQNAIATQQKKFHGHTNVKFGKFNVFNEFSLIDKIPSGSLIFSSYVFSINPKLSEELFIKIIDRKPHTVIHYEPIYELHKCSTKEDRAVQNYIADNDYNKNLLICLRGLEDKGYLKIIRIEKNFFGINPIFPCSIVEWQPK